MVDESRIPVSLAFSGVEQASRLSVLASRQNIPLLKAFWRDAKMDRRDAGSTKRTRSTKKPQILCKNSGVIAEKC